MSFLPDTQWILAEFLDEEPVLRISNMSNNEMIRLKLVKSFGENPDFTDEVCGKMRQTMLDDLNRGAKEEYMSKAGLAMLYDRSGGKLNEEMADIINEVEHIL